MWSFFLLFGLALLRASATGAKPRSPKLPMRRSSNVALQSLAGALDCDAEWYCEDGGACCPDMDRGTVAFCAGSDPFATCNLNVDVWNYCYSTTPIICGDWCCGADEACRDGQCVPRAFRLSSSNSSAIRFRRGKVPASKKSLLRASQRPIVRWTPELWHEKGDPMRNVEEGLHNEFLAVMSAQWRGDGDAVGQCFVLGFPEHLAECNDPWDDGCRGSSAALSQDGPLNYYGSDPILGVTGSDTLSWCNDDPDQTMTHEHAFSYTESKSMTTTLEMSVKTTIGLKISTEFKQEFMGFSATEKFEASFETEFGVTTTESQTETEEKTWTSKQTVQVGPRRHVSSTCFLSTATFSMPFDGYVKIDSPVVWACQDQQDGPDWYYYPENKDLWRSADLESHLKSMGFTQDDLSKHLSVPIGGVFEGVAGYKVECKTHTRVLEDGESCVDNAMIV